LANKKSNSTSGKKLTKKDEKRIFGDVTKPGYPNKGPKKPPPKGSREFVEGPPKMNVPNKRANKKNTQSKNTQKKNTQKKNTKKK